MCSKTVHEINIRTNIWCNRLHARILWEYLFRKVEGYKARHYDSFLCDLYIFERLFKEGKTFYWTHHHPSGLTNITLDNPFENCFFIDRTKDKIIVEELIYDL